jgi:gas vesicle protein
METHTQEQGSSLKQLRGFSAGLLLGGLAGAGAMLLLAPQSGKKTRANIQQGSVELRDQATEAVEDAVTQAGVKARHFRASVRKQVKGLEQRGQLVLEEQKERFSTLVKDEKKAMHGFMA